MFLKQATDKLPVFRLIILASVIIGLGLFGFAIVAVLAVLACSIANQFGAWLSKQVGYRKYLSKLPGFGESDPIKTSRLVCGYVLCATILCWAPTIFAVNRVAWIEESHTALFLVVASGLFGVSWLYWVGLCGATVGRSQGTVTKKFESERFRHQLSQVEKLRAISKNRAGKEFELLVAELFKAQGYVTKVVGQQGDHGVDIELHKEGKKAIVQCKHYKDTVGEPFVVNLLGAIVANNAHEAFLVTTGKFTLNARRYSEGSPIHLIDGQELGQLIESLGHAVPSIPRLPLFVHPERRRHRQVVSFLRDQPVAALFIAVSPLLSLISYLIGSLIFD
jgi:hypothetical protein